MSNVSNRVQLIGRLGGDPEVKNFESGRKMVKFSLATNDHYTDKSGNKVENTEWHNIVMWGKTAEVAENYLSKGKEVLVVGKLTYNQYETEKGERRHYTQINVNEMQLLGK